MSGGCAWLSETIGERFERDRAAMLPLPGTPYEACEKITVRVTSLSLVRYRSNDYSVQTASTASGSGEGLRA